MRSIELRINVADLVNVLSGMREWLDHYRCDVDLFRYETDGASHVIVHAQFVKDDQAELFRTRFEGGSKI
jgi:hypothetical protein